MDENITSTKPAPEESNDIRSYSTDKPAKEKVAKQPATPTKPAAKKPAAPKTAPAKAKQQNVVSKAVSTYTEGAFKHIDSIVKFIAFFIAIILMLGSIGVALLLFKMKVAYATLAVIIAIVGTVFAAIIFFPLYGLGQAICQNKEILRRLDGKK